MRGMLRVMVDGLNGCLHLGLTGIVLAGIQVAVKSREVAAAYLHPDAMASFENLAYGPQVDAQLVDCPWLHQLGVGLRFTISCS